MLEGLQKGRFPVLEPQDIPGLPCLRSWRGAHLALPVVVSDASGGWSDVAIQGVLSEAERRVHCKLNCSGACQPATGAARIPAACQTQPMSDEEAHDAYFAVERVRGDAAGIFLRSILAARVTLLEEASPEAENSHLSIDSALCELLRAACGCDSVLSTRVEDWTPKLRGGALKRWIKGHHIFAVLTQGLIFSFKALGQAIRDGNQKKIDYWADLCANLFKGSAAAFEFTGTFSIEEYNEAIRPTMMCPVSPVNLSGLMSADHRYLVQQMRDMRPALKAMFQTHPERHRQLAESLATVYDSHIHVCERFVGGQPSLLTAGTTEKPGPALVAQFKSVRLKAFEHAARVERVVKEMESQHAGL